MSAPELAVIVPALDAERTLPRTLGRIPKAGLPPLVVILVDDGSRDGTAEAGRRAAAENGLDLEVLRHDANRGYGAAQKTGLRRALDLGCRFHALLHADGQYAPEELPAVVRPLIAGRADMVFGTRVGSGQALAQGMPRSRYLGNRAISLLENLVFGLHFVEYHAGYTAYSTLALRRIEFAGLTDRFHFDGEMLLCAGKLGLRVAEVPIATHYGPESSSLPALPYLWEIAGICGRYLRRGYFFQRRPPS